MGSVSTVTTDTQPAVRRRVALRFHKADRIIDNTVG